MAAAHENPFLWLQTLEQLAKERAKGLPRQIKMQKIWRGIAFRMENVHLVASLEEVRHVMNSPRTMARVPGAKHWVRGIANMDGQLLPVIDLRFCLSGDKPLLINKQSRLLIINQAGVAPGVLVDEVLGIKHFLEESRNHENVPANEWYTPFARGSFKEDEQTWIVFDMQALSKSRAFLDAAL